MPLDRSVRRLCLSGRDGLGGARAGGRDRRGPDHVRRAAAGSVEAVRPGHRRIGAVAVAPGGAAGAAGCGDVTVIRLSSMPRRRHAVDLSMFFPCYNDGNTIGDLVVAGRRQLRPADRRLRGHRRQRRLARRERRRAARARAHGSAASPGDHARAQPRLRRRRCAAGSRTRPRSSSSTPTATASTTSASCRCC